ncbi:MAG: bifunctional (p)ppGpp synthetase/guanosine-3',5'-bis(diphosphate) 3'-pyrophosphohydrolase [Alphaproteobacteria bacterium]|nr:bifunctional (p)ppGpp synthetase/guanosine-3',5'-bis(diphosphate) 3'-pyrophosphohydrolase [Alphaproteobacteria bacterium]
MMRQYELVERVKSYDPDADEALLNRAYVFSMKAHGTQTRASGDPYFSHPLEVAGILTDLKLDTASIVTGLLHDTIEDTATSYEDIERSFGPEIAQLVDGVTKLGKLELVSERTKDAENFRKLLLAMSNDIRVLLVKLADRLHNMRTLSFIPRPEKRRRIAEETMEIYAPLAGRMGMQDVREELEDLAFSELNPDARESIIKRLEFLRAESGDRVTKVTDTIKPTLANEGVEAWVTGRLKRPFSIWKKMEEKSISFEQLSDIFAFRIVVEDVLDCYRALGVLHTQWSTVPGRFKDYISTPKPNNYRSIHTTIIGPEKSRVEIQIRTKEMDEVAERGVAAHWAYKDKTRGTLPGSPYAWLRSLVDMIEQGDAPEEFLEHTKLELFQDQVFCFTPKGALITLPRGATPIDFAYAVHTELGNTCVGAKVNGRHAPLRTVLRNGDEVQILTSKAQVPSAAWEGFVATGKARAAIRRFIRNAQRGEHIRLGRSILEKAMADDGETYADKAIEGAVRRFKMGKGEDLLAAVGNGTLKAIDVVDAIFPGKKRDRRPSGDRGQPQSRIPIKGLIPGLAYHIAACCHPLPGDRIVGIMEPGKGVTVHTIDCDSLEAHQQEPELWLDLGWEAHASEAQISVGRIVVDLKNEPGALAQLTLAIAKANGNISNLRITERNPAFFQFIVDIEVNDAKHLTNLMSALRASPLVASVDRVKG